MLPSNKQMQNIHQITISTTSSFSCHAITYELQELINQENIKEGLLIATSQHTTIALIINEMEERLVVDIQEWLTKIVPPREGYKHDDLHLRKNIPKDEPRNAHSHLKSLLLGNNLAIPITEGKLLLGKFQDAILVELDGPRKRNISIYLRNN